MTGYVMAAVAAMVAGALVWTVAYRAGTAAGYKRGAAMRDGAIADADAAGFSRGVEAGVANERARAHGKRSEAGTRAAATKARNRITGEERPVFDAPGRAD